MTLVALSAGYAIGGRWVDCGPTPSRLYLLWYLGEQGLRSY